MNAPIQTVADALAQEPGLAEYHQEARVRVMIRDPKTGVSHDSDGNLVGLTPSPKERTCFAVLMRGSEWCVVYRTLYWAEIPDTQWVRKAAQRLSRELACSALASCGGGHGLLCYVYDRGEETVKIEGYDRRQVAKQFKGLRIDLPMCFIGGSPAALFAPEDVAQQVERCDRFVVRVG